MPCGGNGLGALRPTRGVARSAGLYPPYDRFEKSTLTPLLGWMSAQCPSVIAPYEVYEFFDSGRKKVL